MKGSALLVVALLAGAAVCQARKTQQRPAQGATGQPVEMSSMAITFYNSGKCLVTLPVRISLEFSHGCAQINEAAWIGGIKDFN